MNLFESFIQLVEKFGNLMNTVFGIELVYLSMCYLMFICPVIFCVMNFLIIIRPLYTKIELGTNLLAKELATLESKADASNLRMTVSLISLHLKQSTKYKTKIDNMFVDIYLRDEKLVSLPITLFYKKSFLDYSDFGQNISSKEELMKVLPKDFHVEFPEPTTETDKYTIFVVKLNKIMMWISTISCYALALSYARLGSISLYNADALQCLAYGAIPVYLLFICINEIWTSPFGFKNGKTQLRIKQHQNTEYFYDLLSALEQVMDIIKTSKLNQIVSNSWNNLLVIRREDEILCEVPLKICKIISPMSGDIKAELSVSNMYRDLRQALTVTLDNAKADLPKGFSVELVGKNKQEV